MIEAGGRSFLQKLHIQLSSQLAGAGGEGGQYRGKGWGAAVGVVGSCVWKVPVARVWFVGAGLS